MKDNLAYEGVIPVNKSIGMTSHDVVAKLRRIFETKRVGHTGTLDPDVSGVLPICVGNATRISEYIMELPKKYSGQLTIGTSTTTQDASGEIIEQVKVEKLPEEKVIEVFERFIGEIEQIPPMYSAVKVNGKKLYEIAREGKEIERKPRKVTIYNLEITKMDLSSDNPVINFDVLCSKGTYIRTLCVDIGAKLGYPAHMSDLVRTKSGPFMIEDSYSIEEIDDLVKSGKIYDIIVSMNDSLPQYKEVVLSNLEIENKVYNGQTIYLESLRSFEGIFKVVNENGDLVALYHKIKNSIEARPKKVFK